MSRFTADGDRDAIALIRASLFRDEEAMLAILRNCDPIPMINAMAEMFSHGTRRGPNDPHGQLDRYHANVDSFIAAHEEGDRRHRNISAWIARRSASPLDDEGKQP